MPVESSLQSIPAKGAFRKLRIWPLALMLAGMIVAPFVPLLIEDGPAMMWSIPAFGPLLCGGGIILWWLLASRATIKERFVGLLGMITVILITAAASDVSMRGPAIMMLTIPMATAAFAVGAMVMSRWLTLKRTLAALILTFLAGGFSTLLRSEGMWGDFSTEYTWRWNSSTEERFLATSQESLASPADANIARQLENPEWPEFRGAERTSTYTGPPIDPDWSANPPKLLWKVGVGPGWSSFAVAGSLLFTQEQRGSMETVVCYDANTGKQIWAQQIESRFDEPLGGPGPRATPTLSGGALFAMGAQGWLMKLNAIDGEILWKQDLRQVADKQPPMWGFSSSPLVAGTNVIVFAGGDGNNGTLAFDSTTGDLRWAAPASEHSYSSPQTLVLNGEALVAMATDAGVDFLDPQNGDIRLAYAWQQQGYRSVQPQMIDADSLIIPTGLGSGTRRIRISSSEGKLAAEELWTSRKLKPDFNDCVLFENHAYGFDVGIFTCIDLETGDRAWKDGRYGKGQVLLLEKSGLLLISGERGEVILVQAIPEKHVELAKFQALKGKTWNHPVVIGDRLYIRNGGEAACYELTLAESP